MDGPGGLRPDLVPLEEFLSDREARVLEALILEYVQLGEPIGSTRLAKRDGLGLSSASIRNVLARLEDLGLLMQPHTSAGRVPTDRAWRVYVDHMMRTPRLERAQADHIERSLQGRGEMSELLDQASKQLAQFTHQVGIALAPKLTQLIVERIEFIRLDPRRVVAVVVSRSGLVHHRMLMLDDTAPSQADLDRDGQFLTERFGGRSLQEMRQRFEDAIERERAELDAVLTRRFDLGQRALAADGDDALIYVDGTSNLLDGPDFPDRADLREVMRTLEERAQLAGLLDRLIRGDGVSIAIGQEIPIDPLTRCSVVASPYGPPGRTLGTVGIVGPTRMEYPRAVALVEHLAALIGRHLSADDDC